MMFDLLNFSGNWVFNPSCNLQLYTLNYAYQSKSLLQVHAWQTHYESVHSVVIIKRKNSHQYVIQRWNSFLTVNLSCLFKRLNNYLFSTLHCIISWDFVVLNYHIRIILHDMQITCILMWNKPIQKIEKSI